MNRWFSGLKESLGKKSVFVIIILLSVCTIILSFRLIQLKKQVGEKSHKIILITNEIIKPQDKGKTETPTQLNYNEAPGTFFRFYLVSFTNRHVSSQKYLSQFYVPFIWNEQANTSFNNYCLKNSDRYFLIWGMESEGTILTEFLFDNRSNQVFNSGVYQINLPHDEYLLSVNSEKSCYTNNSGMCVNYRNKEIFPIVRNSDLRSLCLTDNAIFLQKVINGENYLEQQDLQGKILKTVKFGYDPLIEHDWSFYYPIAVSEKMDKVAFFAKVPVSFEQNNTSAGEEAVSRVNKENFADKKPEFCLCQWNLKTNKAEVITGLEEFIPTYPNSLKWRPGSENNCLALAAGYQTILIDTSTGTIFRRLTDMKNQDIKWSPDGSILGSVNNEGNFCYYDIQREKITKIENIKNSVNFFWVE
ncbi:MAG: hypothetical protein LWY06_10050 [Firmicutes bacterium]|nr:hypothetical protein [Bacillota bacterium]